MNNLMNVDNHMNIGLPYPITWEEEDFGTSSALLAFRAWKEKQESDLYYFEVFQDTWSQAEQFGFAQQGTTWQEFKKFQVETMRKEFEEETGFLISLYLVAKELL